MRLRSRKQESASKKSRAPERIHFLREVITNDDFRELGIIDYRERSVSDLPVFLSS